MNLRKILPALSFIFLITVLHAQRPYKSLEEALLTEGNLVGDPGPADIQWIGDGNKFSYIENSTVIKIFDPATAKEETIFDGSVQSFPGNKTFESFEWSKDGKYIVFRANVRHVWRYSGIADYYLYSPDNKKLTLLATGAYTGQLSPDGKQFGFERDGNIFVTDIAAGTTAQYTSDGRQYFYNGRFGWAYEEEFGLVQGWEWSHDSKHIAFWQIDETSVPIYQYTDYTGTGDHYEKIPYSQPGDSIPGVHIGVIDVSTKQLQWMKTGSGDMYIPRIYWTAEANTLAIVQLNRRQNDMQLFFADIGTGELKKIMEEKTQNWIDVFSFPTGTMHFFYFPSDSKEFFWRSERDGWPHIYRYDYQGNLLNQVTKGNWEVEKMYRADTKNKIIYYLSSENSPLERQLYAVGFDGKNKKQISSAAGMHEIDFSTGCKYYVDAWSNFTTPRQIGLFDIKGKQIRQFVSDNAVLDFTKQIYYSRMEPSSFTNPDGVKIDFGLIKPYDFSEDKKYPLIFVVYGGPEFQDVTNHFYTESWYQYLAQQGYIIVKVNNHGGDGYGSAFKKSVNEKLGRLECKDFAETAKYLSGFKWVDKEKIAIYGHSYGGFTSSFSVFNYPDIFSAAIIGSPVTDWRHYDAIYTERYMGLLPGDKKNYDSSAVLPYVKNIKSKIFIAHSTFDDNVHVMNSMQLLKILIDNGKDADLRLYQSGGHGITYSWESYVLLHKQYTEFLNRNFKK